MSDPELTNYILLGIFLLIDIYAAEQGGAK
jgi:hypothetical protein